MVTGTYMGIPKCGDFIDVHMYCMYTHTTLFVAIFEACIHFVKGCADLLS